MATRAILLVALSSLLLNGIVCADDAPKLTGSAIKTEDIVLKCDAVFVGEITDAGVKWASRPELLHGVQGKSGFPNDQILVSVEMNCRKDETTPKAGNSYIFFVTRNLEGQFFDPFNPLG